MGPAGPAGRRDRDLPARPGPEFAAEQLLTGQRLLHGRRRQLGQYRHPLWSGDQRAFDHDHRNRSVRKRHPRAERPEQAARLGGGG